MTMVKNTHKTTTEVLIAYFYPLPITFRANITLKKKISF